MTTILVVDDDPEVRTLARDILAGEGYVVLEAPGGADALRVAEGHTGPIHLLLTDVVMPGMTGPKLAERLSTTRRETKVLFMSAYTTEHVADYGVFPGDPLIAKPFTVMGLAHRVRQVLNSPSGGWGVAARSVRASCGVQASPVVSSGPLAPPWDVDVFRETQ